MSANRTTISNAMTRSGVRRFAVLGLVICTILIALYPAPTVSGSRLTELAFAGLLPTCRIVGQFDCFAALEPGSRFETPRPEAAQIGLPGSCHSSPPRTPSLVRADRLHKPVQGRCQAPELPTETGRQFLLIAHRSSAALARSVPLLPDVLKPQPPRTSTAIRAAPRIRKEPALIKQAALPEIRYTAGIVSGSPQTTDFAVAHEIATALSPRGENALASDTAVRVIPMVGNGGIQNITDVLTLPGADMAIAPVVLINRLRDSKELGDIRNKLVYIAPLFPEEFHLLADREIRSIRDLAGKIVNLGEEGGAAAVLGREILARLGVNIRQVNIDFKAALTRMQNGEISATLLLSGKPVKALTSVPQAARFHFVAIPYDPPLQQDYLPSTLNHEDYPNLIEADESVDTISVSSALMAYNWSPRSDRFRPLELFVNTLFSRLPEFQTGPHHPKWREVNLVATLPGWTRFRPAERWSQQH